MILAGVVGSFEPAPLAWHKRSARRLRNVDRHLLVPAEGERLGIGLDRDLAGDGYHASIEPRGGLGRAGRGDGNEAGTTGNADASFVKGA